MDEIVIVPLFAPDQHPQEVQGPFSADALPSWDTPAMLLVWGVVA